MNYDLCRAGGDVLLVANEWNEGGLTATMRVHPLSPDGFPRGPALDLGTFELAGVALDAIRVVGTPLGAVVVYHARDTSLSPDLQLYSRRLTCR